MSENRWFPICTDLEMADTGDKEATTFKVRLSGSGSEFLVRKGESVLDAALRQGVMLPYSCKNGTCGSCKGNLQQGEVHYPFHPPLALERSEIANGDALLCQAEPMEDLVVEAREIEAVRDIEVRMLPVRVVERKFLTSEVARLRLRMPRGQRLQFLAGQYVDILLQGGKRRAFSIASAPGPEGELELHVRHVDGGDFTGWVFEDMKVRDILRIEGPLGTFFVRNDEPDRPMIMMGGGTGFAPLKAMIEDLLNHGDERSLHLFWGARRGAELYLPDLPRKWAAEHPDFRFTAALSDDESAPEEAYRGLVHDAVLAAYPDLAAYDVYMSGPPAMIDTAKDAFLARGLPGERLFYDSFEFGLDVPVRILARPH